MEWSKPSKLNTVNSLWLSKHTQSIQLLLVLCSRAPPLDLECWGQSAILNQEQSIWDMNLFDIFISLQTILHTLLGQDIEDGFDNPPIFCSFIQCSCISADDFPPKCKRSNLCKIDWVGDTQRGGMIEETNSGSTVGTSRMLVSLCGRDRWS